jgi:hypothetical protein
VLRDWKETLGATGVLLLLLVASYLTGMLLSSFSGIFDIPVRLFMKKRLGMENATLVQESYTVLRWMNEIALMDKELGATLAKMMAEKSLCQNLLAGFLILVLISKGALLTPMLSEREALVTVLLLAVLVTAVVQRNLAYFYRLKAFHEILSPANRQKA